ncbi:MAG: tetratricopeptide repeat protein [Planctomycetes bacterium]|nr:tetratricopeptide repeat protein [Planctomycetota bacterium]
MMITRKLTNYKSFLSLGPLILASIFFASCYSMPELLSDDPVFVARAASVVAETGATAYQQGDHEFASEQFLRAAEMITHFVAVEYHRTYQEIMIELGRKDEIVPKYKKLFDEASAFKPEYAYLYSRLLDEPLSAIKVLQDGIRSVRTTDQNIGSPMFWLRYGIATRYEELEKYAEAIPHYEAAIAKRPDQVEPFFGLGRMHLLLGKSIARLDRKPTLRGFREVSGEPEVSPEAIALAQQHFTAAEKAFRSVILRASEESRAYHRLFEAVYYQGAERLADLLRICEDAKIRFPENILFPFLEGKAVWVFGDREDARKIWNRLLDAEMTTVTKASEVDALFFAEGMLEFELEIIDRALEEFDDDVLFSIRKGYVLEGHHRWFDALDHYRACVERFPNETTFRHSLAVLLDRYAEDLSPADGGEFENAEAYNKWLSVQEEALSTFLSYVAFAEDLDEEVDDRVRTRIVEIETVLKAARER